MSNSNFSLNQLTEGIRARHLGTQNRRLVEKWSRTGLLRGLGGVNRENMACMLENQASQLLREQNTLGGSTGYPSGTGDIRGFSNVAFPIVRRVFGGLIANDLVSIQPMSLPSGLLFYLDYTYGSDGAGGQDEGQSIYNSPVGKGIRSGSLASGGMYDLGGTGYSRRAITIDGGVAGLIDGGNNKDGAAAGVAGVADTFGCYGDGGGVGDFLETNTMVTTGLDGRLLMFDPQISKKIDSDGQFYAAMFISLSDGASETFANGDLTLVNQIALVNAAGNLIAQDADVQGASRAINVLRLNELGTFDEDTGVFTANPMQVAADDNDGVLKVIVRRNAAGAVFASDNDLTAIDASYPAAAVLDTDDDGSTLVVPSFEGDLLGGTASGAAAMPEIDIKIESVAVTAQSRKLKAKWSPELAQDLNAYHSLDAEVELTQILSEQVALEIDREILNDLLTQANGANLYWSRAPGKFLNKETGAEATASSSLAGGPAFTGTVREWYETLIETIIDAANQIHRKTLRGSANFIVVGPDVATILESSVMYRPSYSLDGEGQVGAPMTIGADKSGTLSNRFTVYKDPYFPRNRILVGYKGGSYLETGYVYAPYVPLIVTPTIFQPEDFTPRKGVMTRYGKKMVRSDFYGTVTVMDMNVI